MSERLTDQQLQILWEQWNPAAVEIQELRARVAKLEAALKPFVSDGPISQFEYVIFKEDARAALQDAPQ